MAFSQRLTRRSPGATSASSSGMQEPRSTATRSLELSRFRKSQLVAGTIGNISRVIMASDILASTSADLITGPTTDDEPSGDPRYRDGTDCFSCLAAMTRPGIAKVVTAVAMYSHDPSERHCQAVVKAITYLPGIREMG